MKSVWSSSRLLAACLLFGPIVVGGDVPAVEPPAAVLQAERARIEAMERAMKTAVSVFAP